MPIRPVFHQLIQLVDVARLDVVLVTKLLDVLTATFHAISVREEVLHREAG